jgi:predicted AlkP superfamily phosphohydrolase/phosphomutase
MQIKKRTVIIGLDGVSYSMFEKLFNHGAMPNFKTLSQQGVLRPMMASLPDNSAVSWTSIMTGTNPGEHGIFGFTSLIRNTYSLRFPNFLDIKAQPFWQIDHRKKYAIINLPFSYPAQPVNGCLIAGFVAPDLAKSVFPESLLKYLRHQNYQTDADAMKAHQSLSLFLDELATVHQNRVQVYRHLWSQIDWDVFFLVFTGTDRIGHFMQHAFENQADENHARFMDYFSRIDQEIGWIAEQLSSHDNLLMLSDHGMELIRTEVNLNTFLQQHDFLALSDGQWPNYTRINDATTAFALEPSRIHLNYVNRYPEGSVTSGNAVSIKSELKSAFRELTYEGEPVIDQILEQQEIYHGNALDDAPDFVLIPHRGFSLRGAIGKENVFEKNPILTGMHRGSDAFLFVASANAQDVVPDQPHVEDIATILRRLEE